MKIRALNIHEVDYILECQKDDPKEDQIILKLTPLSAKQHAVLQDGLEFKFDKKSIKQMQKDLDKGDEETALSIMQKIGNFNEHLYKTLKCGLVGWSNFLDDAGNEVKFGSDMDENINKIPRDYHMELSMKIMDLSTLKAEEVKN